MNASLRSTLAALVLANGAVLAQSTGNAPLTREDVVQQVLKARVDSVLGHAGEFGPEETTYKAQIEAAPTLTRAQVHAAVLRARAARELAHAGSVGPEEEMAHARAHPWTSALTRADVQQQVREALADGSLSPGNAGRYPDRPAAYGRSIVFKASPATDTDIATRGLELRGRDPLAEPP
jgi:hypothetical protein